MGVPSTITTGTTLMRKLIGLDVFFTRHLPQSYGSPWHAFRHADGSLQVQLGRALLVVSRA
jgi:hypothetical protein